MATAMASPPPDTCAAVATVDFGSPAAGALRVTVHASKLPVDAETGESGLSSEWCLGRPDSPGGRMN